MKLTYRGVDYLQEMTPVDLVESGVGGQYRGQTVKFNYPRHIPVPQPVREMQYRGVTYRTTPIGETRTISVDRSNRAVAPSFQPAMALSLQDHSVSFFEQNSIMNELKRIHRENLLRRLQHRMEVAKAKGDQDLINQLEREMRQLA